MKEKLMDRYNILAVFFFIMGIAILFTLVNLQVLNGKKYDEASKRSLLSIKDVEAPRGNIFDRNGKPIAVNRIGFTVEVMNAGLDDDQLNDMLFRLVKLFEKNKDSYDNDFVKYLTYENGKVGFGTTLAKTKDKTERLVNDMGLLKKYIKDLKTPSDYFGYLRERRYEIDKKYSTQDAYKIMCLRFELFGYSTLKSACIARDVSKATVAEIEERHADFPGVTTDVEYLRKYIDAQNEAHVIGYIRGISPEKYEEMKNYGYEMNDLIGYSGIEASAEKYLKGQDGEKRVEMDLTGRMTKELTEKPAVPGDDIYLTLDADLQRVGMESLAKDIDRIKNRRDSETKIPQNKEDASAGAFVAVDVNAGEILAMGSYPTYNPSIFLAGSEDKAAQMAIRALYDGSSDKPELNRAIQTGYAPGSTFKPIVGIAGLEEGVINRSKNSYMDEGIIHKEGRDLKCLEFATYGYTHGFETLKTALATSCNMYFYKLGNDIGISDIDKWGKTFGLGEKTGVELKGEIKGSRSSLKTHEEKGDGGKFGYVYTALSSIGQMYNSFTPVQLANYTATIANGGKKYKPHLIKSVERSDGKVVLETKKDFTQIRLKPDTIPMVKEGMEAVANAEDGTAATIFRDFTRLYNIRVAAKTGTAETTKSSSISNNGVFICYAPADNPKIAIAIVIEHGVWGRFAAPVARDMLMEYFHLNNREIVNDSAVPDMASYVY